MVKVYFGPKVPASWTERWVLITRIFLFTLIPWAFGTVFFSSAWFLSVGLLTILVLVEYFVEIKLIEER